MLDQSQPTTPLAGQKPNCLVLGGYCDMGPVVMLFERLGLFREIIAVSDAASMDDPFSAFDFVALVDTEAELAFFGTQSFPWVLIWTSKSNLHFIPEDRLLIVPKFRFLDDPKATKHFRRMITQAYQGR